MLTVVDKAHTLLVNDLTLEEYTNVFDVPVHPLNAGIAPGLYSEMRSRRGGDWLGGLQDRFEAIELLRRGWGDGASRIESLRHEFEVPAARSRKRRVEWRDNGEELSIERAIRGDWDNAWRSSRRVWAAGSQHIELHSLIGGSAVSSAEQLFWAGATCAVVADSLEASGYTVRIVATTATYIRDKRQQLGNQGYAMSRVTVKEADMPVRTDAVASVLCHAGTFRTLGFQVKLVQPRAYFQSFGPAVLNWSDLEPTMRANGVWSDDAVYVRSAFNRESCISEINHILANLGAANAD